MREKLKKKLKIIKAFSLKMTEKNRKTTNKPEKKLFVYRAHKRSYKAKDLMAEIRTTLIPNRCDLDDVPMHRSQGF